jgi:hypothetical protein
MALSVMINETWYKQFAKLLHCRAIDQSDSAFVVRRNEPINSVHLQFGEWNLLPEGPWLPGPPLERAGRLASFAYNHVTSTRPGRSMDRSYGVSALSHALVSTSHIEDNCVPVVQT